MLLTAIACALLTGPVACAALRPGGEGGPGPEPEGLELAEILSEVRGSPVPAGVDPGVYEELRRELQRVLEDRQLARVSSQAPQGSANIVRDLQLLDDGSGGQLLQWSYVNVGDYDQNSRVAVADLTPIGIHFGKDDTDPDWASFAHVDGDGNGRISVSDVTPIGLNYLSLTAHYEIAAFDAVTELYTPLGEALFELASGSPKRFSVPLPVGGEDVQLAVRPADGAGGFGPWSSAPLPQPIEALPGAAGDLAVDNIPDMGFSPPQPSDYFIREDNFSLSHTLLAGRLADSATVGEVNAAIAAAGATIVGANPRGQLLQLRISASDFSAMPAVLEGLTDSGAFAEAVMDMCGGPESLPLHASDGPSLWTFEPPFYSFLPLSGANYWIKLVRAPQVWNLDTYVRRYRATTAVEAAVMDTGYFMAHADLASRISLGGSANGPVDKREHGTFVCGMIGADGGNGIGTAGLYPWGQRIHARSLVLKDTSDVISWNQQLHQIIELLFHEPAVRAVNNSYGLSSFYTHAKPAFLINPVTDRFGDRNGDGDNSDPNEWQPLDLNRNGAPDTYREVMAVMGRMYNNSISNYRAERGDERFVIIASAGNAGAGFQAVDNSPIANAALSFGGHFLAVEATTSTNALASFSDRGGSLSAPGDSVRSTEAADAVNFDHPGCAPRDAGDSFHDLAYATSRGTSFAAPQAAALACLLWKLEPTLSLAQVRSLLTQPAYTVSTASAPRLDCFSAAMGIDGLLGNNALQSALLDVDDGSPDGNLLEDPFDQSAVNTIATADQRRGDGIVDMSDFRAYRDAWLQANSASLSIASGSISVVAALDGPAGHFKKDLNLDGAIGAAAVSPAHPVDIGLPEQLSGIPAEDVFPRCDFNGDGRLGSWAAAAPFKLDPDTAYGSLFSYTLGSPSAARRDLDVLLDPACWTGNDMENAGNLLAQEGSNEDNGSWLPRRFILSNRDSYISTAAAQLLKDTPDYLHSFDLHLRINWGEIDAAVSEIDVVLATDMWPNGLDDNGIAGSDEPFEQSFERRRTFARQSATQDIVVSLPLWTGAMRLSWSAFGGDGDCDTQVSRVFTGLAFGQNLGYELPGEGGATSNWDIQTLDSGSAAGEHSSIALVGGRPAIAYSGAGQLRFIRAADALGSAWGNPQDLVAAGGIGSSVNLSVIAGRPCIGYSDSSFDDEALGTINAVAFVRGSDANGSAWDSAVRSAQISTGIPQMGWHNALLEVGGKPAMCFLGEDYEMINGTALNFTSASAADGAGWNPAEKVDSAGSPEGLWCSMAVVEGKPAIAYLSSVNNKLCFVRASSADGSSWQAAQELDGAGGFDYFNGPYPGRHACLSIVDGNPAIAYYGGSDLEYGSMLKYIRALDSGGSNWDVPLILHSGSPEPGAASGLYCSLAVVGGLPAVAFHNMGDGDLLYVGAADAEGYFWYTAELADCSGDVGRWSSLCELSGGLAGISYYDAGNEALKFARRLQ
ncbi:S8 family serine peptidase [bacterium]|nr:S8 family serine peptidase [bacterium]